MVIALWATPLASYDVSPIRTFTYGTDEVLQRCSQIFHTPSILGSIKYISYYEYWEWYWSTGVLNAASTWSVHSTEPRLQAVPAVSNPEILGIHAVSAVQNLEILRVRCINSRNTASTLKHSSCPPPNVISSNFHSCDHLWTFSAKP